MKIKKLGVPYAQVPNSILFDEKLSFQAKGLWSYIQAKPNDWDFSSERMAEESTDGVRAIRTGLQDLVKAGVLKKRKLSTGRMEYKLIEKAKVPKQHSAETAQCRNSTHNKERDIQRKNTSLAEASSASWALEEKLKDMEAKAEGHLNVIATFIREKPVKIDNSKQLSNVIARYSRVAIKMAGAYTPKEIFDAIDKIKAENRKRERTGDEVDWTLDTIFKKLTK